MSVKFKIYTHFRGKEKRTNLPGERNPS